MKKISLQILNLIANEFQCIQYFLIDSQSMNTIISIETTGIMIIEFWSWKYKKIKVEGHREGPTFLHNLVVSYENIEIEEKVFCIKNFIQTSLIFLSFKSIFSLSCSSMSKINANICPPYISATKRSVYPQVVFVCGDIPHSVDSSHYHLLRWQWIR